MNGMLGVRNRKGSSTIEDNLKNRERIQLPNKIIIQSFKNNCMEDSFPNLLWNPMSQTQKTAKDRIIEIAPNTPYVEYSDRLTACRRLFAKYVYGRGLDDRIPTYRSTNNYWYHTDGLGNVTEITDGSGTIIEQYRYDVYGKPTIRDGSTNVLSASAIGNRLLFNARDRDPDILLYNYRYRYYSPGFGRFLQPNPIGFSGGDVNLYRYTLNNPVNEMDPMGLFNYLKTGVCFANVGWGSFQAARGATLITAGGTVVKVGIGFPAVALGTKDLIGAFLKIRQGSIQCREAMSDPCPGHWKNIRGLAPFGNMIDDPDETLSGAWDKSKEKPWYERLGEVITYI
jgi:RHS repeat-associated protein